MATATIPERNTKVLRLVSWVSIAAGLLMIAGGISTWALVRSHLVDERITVATDAAAFGGSKVTGPLEAYYEADIIAKHSLAATGGKTYAELDREDPLRATAMNGSFLRASLFTSVIAFGVAAFAIGAGLLFLLIGWALRKLVPAEVVVTVPKVTAVE